MAREPDILIIGGDLTGKVLLPIYPVPGTAERWTADRVRALPDDERRRLDRVKLRAMVEYCQTTRCRTRYILEYFGEDVDPEWRCDNCDACDAMDAWEERRAEAAMAS